MDTKENEKKKYSITKETYKNKSYLWDSEAEVLLALFAKRLCEIRPQLKFSTVTKDIIERYIRKNKDSIVGPTKIMREVNEEAI